MATYNSGHGAGSGLPVGASHGLPMMANSGVAADVFDQDMNFDESLL